MYFWSLEFMTLDSCKCSRMSLERGSMRRLHREVILDVLPVGARIYINCYERNRCINDREGSDGISPKFIALLCPDPKIQMWFFITVTTVWDLLRDEKIWKNFQNIPMRGTCNVLGNVKERIIKYRWEVLGRARFFIYIHMIGTSPNGMLPLTRKIACMP